MKKVYMLLLSTVAFLLMAGCTGDSPVQAAASSVSRQEDWGIELQAQNVTPTYMSLVCIQSGGNATGSLEMGSDYTIEQEVNGTWRPLGTKSSLDWLWTMEAQIIQRDSTIQWGVYWENLYGPLLPGKYRLSKVIMDFRGPGDFSEQTYYAEFSIVD